MISTIVKKPRNSLNRLSKYHSYLKVLRARGEIHISSGTLSEKFGCDQSGVRKDLELTGIQGRPRIGFEIQAILDGIEQYLGWQQTVEAVFVGSSRLGLFLNQHDFLVKGLKLLCGFDLNYPNALPRPNPGLEFFPINKLPELTRRLGATTGILCAPARQVQRAANLMIDGGINAIWNFSPFEPEIPKNITIENINLSASFAVLVGKITEMESQLNNGAKNVL